MLTLEEQVTRLVADVDWSDECEVVLHVRKRSMRLTPDQARRIAEALTRCADEADRAADGAVRPVAAQPFDVLGPWRGQVKAIADEIGATVIRPEPPMSPDCREGKHPVAHHDTAWDDVADVEVPCGCPCHAAHAGETAA